VVPYSEPSLPPPRPNLSRILVPLCLFILRIFHSIITSSKTRPRPSSVTRHFVHRFKNLTNCRPTRALSWKWKCAPRFTCIGFVLQDRKRVAGFSQRAGPAIRIRERRNFENWVRFANKLAEGVTRSRTARRHAARPPERTNLVKEMHNSAQLASFR